MASFDKTILVGNLVRDPELRVTPKGTPVCQFGIAINHTYVTESGEKREEVVFLDCECWGKRGETVAKYFTKGKPILVEGRHKLEQWEDKTTKQKRSRIKIVVEQFRFVDSGGGREREEGGDEGDHRGERSQGAAGGSQSGRGGFGGGSSRPASTENLDEDVPF
jgi:single-strand DNA-binding protein